MRRLMACLLLSSLVSTLLSGCGAVRVQGFFDSGVSTVSGFVSGVQVTTVPGANGTVIVVTVVTFRQALGFTTANFCGNFGSQFPLSAFAQVNFKPGQPCSTVVVIIIN